MKAAPMAELRVDSRADRRVVMMAEKKVGLMVGLKDLLRVEQMVASWADLKVVSKDGLLVGPMAAWKESLLFVCSAEKTGRLMVDPKGLWWVEKWVEPRAARTAE